MKQTAPFILSRFYTRLATPPTYKFHWLSVTSLSMIRWIISAHYASPFDTSIAEGSCLIVDIVVTTSALILYYDRSLVGFVIPLHTHLLFDTVDLFLYKCGFVCYHLVYYEVQILLDALRYIFRLV